MFNKKLQKFSIRKLSVGAASVLIGISFISIRDNNTVHAADMPVATTAQTSSASSAIETAQAHVDSAQSNLNKAQSNLNDAQQKADQANKAYNDQAYKADSANQKADATKQALDQANDQVSNAQKGVDDANKPGVKENAQKNITDKETALTNAQEAAKAVETKANNAAQEVTEATQDVNAKQNDVNAKQADKNKADADVKAAQDALKDSSLDQAAKNLADANAKVSQDQTSLKNADKAVDQATQNKKNTEANLDQAQKASDQANNSLQKAQADYDAKKKASDQANATIAKDKVKKDDLQKQLDDLKDKSKNNIVISDIDKFKQVYSHGELMSDEDFAWTKKENAENHYISSDVDKKELVYPNKMTDDQIKELSLFIADLQTKVRKQLGWDSAEVTKGSMELAKEIAKNYVADSWDDPKNNPNVGWHDEDAIKKAVDKLGIGTDECKGGTFVMSRHQDGEPTTMDDLKRGAYQTFVDMILPAHAGTYAPGKTAPELGHGYGLLGIGTNENNELVDTSKSYINDTIRGLNQYIQEYNTILAENGSKGRSVYTPLTTISPNLPHTVFGASVQPYSPEPIYQVLYPTGVSGDNEGEKDWKIVSKQEFESAVRSFIKQCNDQLIQQKQSLNTPTFYSGTIYESSHYYDYFTPHVEGEPYETWKTPNWEILFEMPGLSGIHENSTFDRTIIPSYADQIANINKQITAIDSELATLNSSASQTEQAQQALNKAQNALKDAQIVLNNAKNSNISAQNALNNAIKFQSQIQTKLANDQKDQQEKQATYNMLLAEPNKKADNLKAAVSAQTKAANALKDAQKALANAQNKLNGAKQNQTAANNDVLAKKEAIQQAQTALNNAKTYLANLNKAPEMLAVALNGQKVAQSNYDAAKKNADAENEKLNKLKPARDAADKALDKAQAVVSDAQQELSNAESELASAQSAYEASQTPAINNSNSKETPMTGVAHIKNNVTLVNGKGEAVSQTINADTNYKVFAKKTINGKTYYRLGTDNQWVVEDAVSSITDGVPAKSNAEEPFAAHGYIPVLNSHPTWKIALVDGNGNYTGQYLPTNTKWKVFAKKTINDQTYYRLGTDQQWIPASFLQVKKTGVVKANPVKNHPTWKIALLNQNGEYTGKFVKPNTSWKVLDVEFINGRMMARIGNQAQWIPMDYVAWVK
ncbi:SEC10/PgrA surface exclusion domain-containing protein [Lactobacillus rodentium]|nr:SEC10/PgrA surface exclusion domain-containing protein [Lactobacillus rodentium]MCR1894127.1 SEC10/PgrA surface exclusion domain-containing protein [Lactobacillus rodentium]